MPKTASLHIAIDPDLHARFNEAAKVAERDVGELIAELMQDYVEQQDESDAAYDAFVRMKVEKARVSMLQGQGRSNEEVEATFSALRRQLHNDRA